MREIVIDQPGAALYKQTSGNANELNYDAKRDVPYDPIALRFGSWRLDYFGKLCGDFLSGDPADPRRSERIFVAFRTDDHPAAAAGAGCIEVYMQTAPVGHETDAGEKLLVRLTQRAGLELFVPLNAYAGGPATQMVTTGLMPDTMWAPNGKAFTQQQDDGNFVTYVTDVPFSKDPAHARAIWSSGTAGASA